MIEDDAFIEEVEASLRHASDGQLARVMRFIDRLPARGRLDDVVAPVRGRLAMVRPARSLTLARVLTLPIEDLLVDTRYDVVSPWVLPRDILPVFHQLCLGGLDEASRRAAEEEIPGATMDDREAVVAAGRCLWPAAAGTLRKFLADGDLSSVTGYRSEHAGRLVGMAEVLEHAEDFTAFFEQLPPRPMLRLSSEARAVAMALLFRAGHVSPSVLRYAFTMLTRRSADPAEFLMLLLNRDFGLGEPVRDAILSEAVSESLAEMALINEEISAWTPDGQVYFLAENASRLVSLLQSLEGLPEPLRPEPERLASIRRDAAETLVRQLDKVWKGPVHDAFMTLTPSSADSVASNDQVGLIEGLARAVRRVDIACVRLAPGAARDELRRRELEIHRLAIGYKAAGVTAHGLTNGADIDADMDMVMDALRFSEILFGTAFAMSLAEEVGIA